MGGGRAGFPDAGNVKDGNACMVNTTASNIIKIRIIGSVNLVNRPKVFQSNNWKNRKQGTHG